MRDDNTQSLCNEIGNILAGLLYRFILMSQRNAVLILNQGVPTDGENR
jgi:hypothetical protein